MLTAHHQSASLHLPNRQNPEDVLNDWNGTSKLTSGQRILEDLLKAKKLENRQVDGRMEAQSTFVGPEGGVELDAEAPVDVALTVVVFPGDAKLDDALGDGADGEGFAEGGVLLEEGGVVEGGGQFCGGACLVVLRGRRWTGGGDAHLCKLVRTRARRGG